MGKTFKLCMQNLSQFRLFAKDPLCGALAQLVERNNGIVEAIGSNPIRSIS